MDNSTKNASRNAPRSAPPSAPQDDGTPKFGRLLLVCLAAVAFCGLLTWLMSTYFPDFPNW